MRAFVKASRDASLLARPLSDNLPAMSTITAILEPDSDGCLHLPVPEELRGGKVKVIASLETVTADEVDHARLVRGEFGRDVLIAPPGAPPMTPERIKAILDEEA